MANYILVQVSFWQDEFVMELTPEEKFFYFYLMTNPKSECGVLFQSKKLIELETGYSRDVIDKLIDRFIEYGKVLYNNDTKEFMLVDWNKKYGCPLEHAFYNSSVEELLALGYGGTSEPLMETERQSI